MFGKNLKAGAAAFLALALASCAPVASKPLQPERPASFALEWEENVGAMSLLLRLDFDDDYSRVCAMSRAGRVAYLDVATGERVGQSLKFPRSSGEEYIAGAACLDEIVSGLSSDGWLRVLHATEGLLWQENLKTHVYSVPLITDGKLYVVGLDGRLLAYTLKKGRELWRYVSPLENLVRTPVESSVTDGGDAVLAGIDNGAIVSLDKSSGQVRWENTVSSPSGSNSIANILDVTTPVLVGDAVCASAYQAGVACFRAEDGERLWHQPLSAYTRVAGDDEETRLFATDDNGALYAFDIATGKVLWRNKNAEAETAPVFMDGMVLAGNRWGEVRAFYADDGSLATSFELVAADILQITPLPQEKGALLVLAQDGLLVRLTLQTDAV